MNDEPLFGGRWEAGQFVDRLRAHLKAEGVSQSQLARAAVKSRPEVNRWLRRQRRPSLENMIVLDNALRKLRG